MPLTPVELYRAERHPAPSPASFHSCVYGGIKVNLVLGWGEFRFLCVLQGRILPMELHQSCIPHVPVATGVAGVTNRADLACPATSLLLCSAGTLCGLVRGCWPWGKSPSCLGWGLGCFSSCPAPALLWPGWVSNSWEVNAEIKML